MYRRLGSILLGLTLVLGACGLIGPATAPSATPSLHDQAVAAWTNAVQCARDHGWNIPDPVIDEQGNASFPADVGKPPADVLEACQRFLDALPNQTPTQDGPTADDIRMGRQFAACMRQNGQPNWPDPNADGTFPLTPELQAEGKSPVMLDAMRQCDQYHPSGRIFFAQPVNGG
jgi:hypothetical protein